MKRISIPAGVLLICTMHSRFIFCCGRGAGCNDNKIIKIAIQLDICVSFYVPGRSWPGTIFMFLNQVNALGSLIRASLSSQVSV